jgi:DNA-binding beta-propeller fold protein YncE
LVSLILGLYRGSILAAAACVVALVVLPVEVTGAAPRHPGGVYLGETSQDRRAEFVLSDDGSRIRAIRMSVEARCRRIGIDVSHLEFTKGRPARRGEITGEFSYEYDDGADDPTVARGRLIWRFVAARRVVGSVRLRIRGEYLVDVDLSKTVHDTCHSGQVLFSAEAPPEARSRLGELSAASGEAGCYRRPARTGCLSARALHEPSSIIISPDGRHLYAAGARDAPEARPQIASFARESTTGTLQQLGGQEGCVNRTGKDSCAAGRGMHGRPNVAISGDGRHLYVAGSTPWGSAVSASIAVFARDQASGALSQAAGAVGCLGDPIEGCGAIGSPGQPEAIAMSPDGRQLYISWKSFGPDDRGVSWYERDPISGGLSSPPGVACLSSRGTQGCERASTVLHLESLLASRDGRALYAADAGGITAMIRDLETGRLSEASGPGRCLRTRTRGICGRLRVGEEGRTELVSSPNGRNLYLSVGSSVAILRRRGAGPGLTQATGTAGCLTDGEEVPGCRYARGLEEINGLAVSPDGRNVYVGATLAKYSAYGRGAIAVFARSPNGSLVQLRAKTGCVSGSPNALDPFGPLRCSTAGIRQTSGIAISPGGEHVYAGWATFDESASGLTVLSRRMQR